MIKPEEIKARMARVGVTQWRLAVESGLSLTGLASWLQGRVRYPRAETLDRIERAMAELERQYDESL